MTQQMIKSVAAEAPSKVTIFWRSGKHSAVELAEYLESPGYEKLRDPAFFVSVTVEEWGHGIKWGDGEIGIDADTLYRLGKEQTGLRSSTVVACGSKRGCGEISTSEQ